jgi:hypothetical protein
VSGVVQPRTIVFDVAGTFWLGRYGVENGHDNGWDTTSRYNLGSHITVAGQTAPGPVYIIGGLVKASGTNAILRNVTIAPGYGMRNFSKPEDGVFPTQAIFPIRTSTTRLTSPDEPDDRPRVDGVRHRRNDLSERARQ